MTIIRTLLILLVCFCGNIACAHNRSESFSEWTWRGDQLHYTFSILQREATRLPPSSRVASSLGDLLSGYLQGRIVVAAGGQACSTREEATAVRSRGGFLHVEGSFDCSGIPTITVNSFFDLVASHTHYARVRSDGQVEEFVLTDDQRQYTLAASEGAESSSLGGWQAFRQYLVVGAEHIVAGVDHLAFLFGLMLLASGWREMAWLITGFTLGHSLSLALAVLGIAQPNGLMVEALIGFTIALVAIETAGERSEQLRRIAPWLFAGCLALAAFVWWASLQWKLVIGTAGAGLFALCYLRIVDQASSRGAIRILVTSMFGVIHGFGFAGGLLEFDFPTAELAFVLLGFNLGVELGQLAVLIVVLGLAAAVTRVAAPQWREHSTNAAVMVLGGLGTFWFIGRLFG